MNLISKSIHPYHTYAVPSLAKWGWWNGNRSYQASFSAKYRHFSVKHDFCKIYCKCLPVFIRSRSKLLRRKFHRTVICSVWSQTCEHLSHEISRPGPSRDVEFCPKFPTTFHLLQLRVKYLSVQTIAEKRFSFIRSDFMLSAVKSAEYACS